MIFNQTSIGRCFFLITLICAFVGEISAASDLMEPDVRSSLERFERLSEDIKNESRNKRVKILFEDVLHVINEQVSGEGASCLLSHACRQEGGGETQENDEWIRKWNIDLKLAGVKTTLDYDHLHGGHFIPGFMSLSDYRFVMLFCTPACARRASDRSAGMFSEVQDISIKLRGGNSNFYIPIVLEGEPGSSIPALLNPMERYWYDARDKTAYYDVFFDILKYKLLQHLPRVDIDTLKSDFNHIKEGYIHGSHDEEIAEFYFLELRKRQREEAEARARQDVLRKRVRLLSTTTQDQESSSTDSSIDQVERLPHELRPFLTSSNDIEITTENVRRILSINQTTLSAFMHGIFVKNWMSSRGNTELLEILTRFTNIKKMKIQMKWVKENEENEFIECIERAVRFYPNLHELDISDCRLTNQTLLNILQNLSNSDCLKTLRVRRNYLSAGIIEEISVHYPSIVDLDIEKDEYPPLKNIVQWNAPSELYTLYHKAMTGYKAEYDQLMEMCKGNDSYVLSYGVLSALTKEGVEKALLLANTIDLDVLREKARKMDPEIQNNLGMVLYCLADFQEDSSIYMQEGYSWCRKAANVEFSEADISLSYYSVINEDIDAAIQHCERAGQKGNSSGFLKLGIALYPKKISETISPDERLEIGHKLWGYVEKAAELDNVDAQFWVAENCASVADVASGESARVIKEKMIRWYTKAAENGHERSREKLIELGLT